LRHALLILGLSSAVLLSSCKVSQPGSVESSVMKQVKQKVTVGGKNDANPVADNQASADEGKGHFMHHCQICHGNDGQNTGVPFAQQMSPPVADLKSQDVQGYTDGQLHWIIQNGINPSGMPAWKGILEDDEMWKIVRYIRHLPEKGSVGIPDVFKEEQEEHEQMHAAGKADHDHAHATDHDHAHEKPHSH
jgi:mono/diheme cytochrome c family protein